MDSALSIAEVCPVSALKRHRNVLIALLLTVCVAGLGTVSFERKVATFEPIGFEATFAENLWHVHEVTDPALALEVGDLIVQVAGEQPRTAKRLREVLHEEAATDLVVNRGAGLAQIVYQRPNLDVEVSYLVLCLVGLVYLGIGLFTVLRRARTPAMLFFLWCLTTTALYVISPPLAGPQDGFDQLALWMDQVAASLLPALTMHLLLVFPAVLPTLERFRLAIPFLYLPGTATLVLHADLFFNQGRWLAGPVSPGKLDALAKLDLTALVLFSLAGAVVFAIRLARQGEWESRRQVQWMLAGLVAGYVPFAGLYGIGRVLDWPRPDWVTVVAVLALGLVPLGFAYAILKFRLWDVGPILRDAVANTLTLILGVFAFVLINQALSRSVGPNLGALRNLLAFGAGLGIAGVLAPARGVIAGRLDRLRYGRRMAERRALERLGDELMHERNLDRLGSLLVQHLRTGLGVEQVNILLATPGGLVPLRPEIGLPGVFSVDAFDQELWTREVLRLAGAPLQPVANGEQRLYFGGYRYIFPLAVRDQPVGLAVISNRVDDAPLTSEDQALARGLLNQAALAIENATLLDEVQRKLREVTRLEASTKGILESSPAGIALVDDGGMVSVANHAFAAIVGVPRAEIFGQPLVGLVPVASLLDVEDGVTEVAWCDAGGAEHYLQVSVARHEAVGEDDPPQAVVVIQDISQQRRMEASLQEQERLASLGLLAAGVAHEVNTPLTGISSYAQLLLDDLPAEHPHRRLLEKMERQTFRASQIVNNLLDFARHRGEPMRALAVEKVVAECLDSLAPRLADAGVSLRFDRGSDGVKVLGHEGELTQVLTNLMINAVDAMTSQDEALPRVLGVVIEQNIDQVAVRIADSGPGIPVERLARVFEPFFSSKLHSGGTGLGLAISHNIVRRHGGEMRVENLSERGCCFTIRLPRPAPSE
jgi:PAS domain S-box-containing protein